MNIKEKIEVMQAFEDGKAIFERCIAHGAVWKKCEHPIWDWSTRQYVAKEEPREIWVNIYDNGDYIQIHNSEFDATGCISEGGKTFKFIQVMEDE